MPSFTMKYVFLILFAFSVFCNNAEGQNPYINAGNDTTFCAGSVTFNATVTNIPQSTGYTVNNIPYSPPYPFNQGTVLPVPVDDEYSGIIPIGFTFCFYGTPHTDLLISTNNYLCFDLTQSQSYSPWPINAGIPDPNYTINQTPVDAIMGPWVDIDPSVGGVIRYFTVGTAPFRKFVVNFENVPYFSCNNLFITNQFVLYETTNIIETYIMSSQICSNWNGGAAIHGLHDATGTNAAVVPGRNFPTQWQTTNDAWQFAPNGPPTSYTVSWTNLNTSAQVGTGNSVTVTPGGNTCYGATVTYGCSNASFTDTVCANIGIPGLTLSSTNIQCNGQTNGTANITVTGPGPYTYNWSTGATTNSVSNLGAGTYTVTVTDGACTFTDTITIVEPPVLTATSLPGQDTCSRGVGFATATPTGGVGPYSYLWSPGGQTTQTATGLAGGNYNVVITDANGCTTTVFTPVGNLAGPSAAFTVNTSPSSTNTPVNFTDASSGGGGNIVSWFWDFGDTTYAGQNPPAHSWPSQGTYCVTLTVTNSLGCVDSSDQCVVIADSVTVPNVITPNGDTYNEFFEIENLLAYPNSQLFIYNRWGNIVLEDPDYRNNWKADQVSDGTYFYVLNVNDGKGTVKAGYLTILRGK